MQKYKRKGSVLKAKGFISEFRDFISRGNVMDMAVGVLIGGAFSSIVTSLTEDVKTCPYCLMKIPIGAVRCGHCTSELEPSGTPSPEAE